MSTVSESGRRPAGATAADRAPVLAEGVQLIGEFEGSGFKEPPSLVRRGDGQVIQLPDLLYRLVRLCDGRRSYDELAVDLSAAIERQVDPDDVRFLVDEKLRAIGVLAAADGSSPPMQKLDPFLALKVRIGVIPERVSERVGTVFKPLFLPLVVVVTVVAFTAAVVWVLFEHGVAQALRQTLYNPGLFLLLFAGVVLSAGFHEFGHAAGCRYGGGHPGRMGCGLYLAWPAFFTDVTDTYRLGRAARLRTDLGGVYFNAVIVVGTVAAFLVTGFEPLLLLVVVQLFEIVHQLMPVIRLDGYYVVADLTGVPDLFSRIGPILRSAVPGRQPDERVTVLKPWVRIAVTAWVFVVVPLLLFELLLLLLHLPRILGTAWSSASDLLNATSDAFGKGNVLAALSSTLQLVVLAIPVAGIVFVLVRSFRQAGRWLWRRTAGRPLLRLLSVTAALAATGLLVMTWIPGDNYRPIQPGEKGTVGDAITSARRVTTNRGQLRVPPAAPTPAAQPARSPSADSPAEERTDTPGGRDEGTPSPTTVASHPSTTVASSPSTTTARTPERSQTPTTVAASPTTTARRAE